MTDRPGVSGGRAFAFGPFQLFPSQQLLLEAEMPVRVGGRALELLTALVERAGELISKHELMSRVWPDTLVEEANLKAHIAALRRVLGDGRPGRRYIANVPGRGYTFVAPVHDAEHGAALLSQGSSPERAEAHNLRIPQIRAIGRADAIGTLAARLPQHRLVTVVGAAGIGKTTVALAVAEALISAYADGVWLVDLASLSDERLVPSAVAATVGIAISRENAIGDLTLALHARKMLIVLDNCEHVAETAATLAEHVIAGAPGVDILATSREPLRAQEEHIYRLSSLDVPRRPAKLTATEATAYSSVQLFVERAAANAEGYELSDDDAPFAVEICRRLDGIALEIELAAARVDAFGVRQLSSLLDDRFRVLNRGKRTALPRHQSLRAALDWSWDHLSEMERTVLRRLSVFAGAFTLDSAAAILDGGPAVVAAIADLVTKSLITAEVGDRLVRYRMLETTRAYAAQKLAESGEAEDHARRHAWHLRDMMEQAESEWRAAPATDWLERYGHSIDDVRNALSWAYSQNGDSAIGAALTIAATPLWYQLGMMAEFRSFVSRALDARAAEPRQEIRLREAFGLTALFEHLPDTDDNWTRALFLAQELGDRDYQLRALWGLHTHYSYKGDFTRALAIARQSFSVATGRDGDAPGIAQAVLGIELRYLGDYGAARRHLSEAVLRLNDVGQSAAVGHRFAAQGELSSVLWLLGFPDQAIRNLETTFDDVRTTRSKSLLSVALATVSCPLALFLGDLSAAEAWVRLLLELTAGNSLIPWSFQAHCLQGALRVARGDVSRLTLLRKGLEQLRDAGFGYYTLISQYFLADGLRSFGQTAEARATIDQAIAQSDRSGERWLMPELLRIKGELLRQGSSPGEAEDWFLQSLDWARRQQALSWELRAATSLARLRRDAGRDAEARNLLSEVYGRFTEGFDTQDLRAARALLDEIGDIS